MIPQRVQFCGNLTGLIFGVIGVLGLLIGGLGSGFVLAIFMANAGGAWDNAKKFVEEGNFDRMTYNLLGDGQLTLSF